MNDHHSIKTTVQQVADGEITLQQATERLLASDGKEIAASETPTKSQRETEPESLPSLIRRLGNPPTDIIDRWCQQLRELLQSSPRPIDHFSLADLEVTSGGQIRFAEDFPKTAPNTDPTVHSSEEINAFISKVRHCLIQPATQQNDNPWWLKVAMFAGIALCGGALFWVVRSNSTIEVAEPEIDNSLAGLDSSSHSLQTLQSLEQTSDEEITMLEADSAPKFSLEDLIPSIPQPAADDANKSETDSAMQTQSIGEPSSDQEAVSPRRDNLNDSPAFSSTNQTGSNQTILSDDSLDADQPDELQQATHSAISASVKLPPTEQTDPVIIDDQFPDTSAPENLMLAFPHSVDLSIQPSGDGNVWNIVEKKGSNVLANINIAKNNLMFAWADSAAKHTGSRSLHHGRITSSDGSAFFLRPEIEAEPWPIRLDQPDMRPTWNLGSPLPLGVTRLSVEVDLPEELEMTWVEPIPADSSRRARGLAILKPIDGESVDLAIKFDVRCGRKLSCRLRYAARLDSSMPWQLVSRDLLEQFANQLAGRAEMVSHEADRLQNVYDLAGTRGKRIIRIKQKHNDGLSDSLRQYADRVAELESLIANIESSAVIRYRIWVQWPSGEEQTVFASVDDRQ